MAIVLRTPNDSATVAQNRLLFAIFGQTFYDRASERSVLTQGEASWLLTLTAERAGFTGANGASRLASAIKSGKLTAAQTNMVAAVRARAVVAWPRLAELAGPSQPTAPSSAAASLLAGLNAGERVRQPASIAPPAAAHPATVTVRGYTRRPRYSAAGQTAGNGKPGAAAPTYPDTDSPVTSSNVGANIAALTAAVTEMAAMQTAILSLLAASADAPNGQPAPVAAI